MKAKLVIEMPENCHVCLCQVDGLCRAVEQGKDGIYLFVKDTFMERPDWCPLEEVKE